MILLLAVCILVIDVICCIVDVFVCLDYWDVEDILLDYLLAFLVVVSKINIVLLGDFIRHVMKYNSI